ncbi:MAG: TetR/AcrR family transcriptional regulator [Rhodospirillaceae bacterium]|nr:MAG: TetR/AcrR family transcriptional regulator [Rhodospirillaceae bacterium]
MPVRLLRASAQRSSPKIRRGAGRPTREEAVQRHTELLDKALELFLERGFEMATIDAIAASVGMTKRTVYARYKDKTALFKASVERAIERWIVPIETLRAVESHDLQATLMAVGRILVGNALSPAGQRLMRVINVESYRFPDIAKLTFERGSKRTIAFLADLLRRFIKTGAIKVASPEGAAVIFLTMVVGGPSRAIMWGQPADKATIEERTSLCVQLFLNGIRPR